MQRPYPPNDENSLPPTYQEPRKKHHGRVRRFFNGYLMLAGAIATLCGLVLLMVSLFVEIGKWI